MVLNDGGSLHRVFCSLFTLLEEYKVCHGWCDSLRTGILIRLKQRGMCTREKRRENTKEEEESNTE